MSVSKPFVFALVCQALGPEQCASTVGVNATGSAFNALDSGRAERRRAHEPDGEPRRDRDDEPRPRRDRRREAGSSSTTASRASPAARSRVDEEVYASASATNDANRTSHGSCSSHDRIYWDPAEAVDLYTRQCSLGVSARDLAVMGATLADGGVNPLTHERVVEAETCRFALAVMTTAGLYETSGDWLYDIGLPGKSGIGGGIVTVAPGKGGLGTFSPPLDAAGNSVRGQLAAKFISWHLGMDLFASKPET